MVGSLRIRNFRLFKYLEIPEFHRVNLVVGKNNSGKSCLLEAMQVYAARGNLATLHGLISARDEDHEKLDSQGSSKGVYGNESALRHLFFGYHFPDPGDDGIEIGPIGDEENEIRIRTAAYQYTEDKEGRKLRRVVGQEGRMTLFEDLVDVHVALELLNGEKSHYLGPISEYERQDRYRIPLRHDQMKTESALQIVPTRNMSDDLVAELWDNINLTDLEEEVVSCLRIIDKRVKGVALVGSTSDRYQRKKDRIPIVRLEGSEDRTPLKTMGDGITRLFHIVLALVNARNGCLLIDEFENGLHWRIHSKLWDIVFQLSDRLNVQVFATTHSQDCIRGFHEIWVRQEQNGSFFRLDPDPAAGARATKYACDTLFDALETDVEVR